MNESARFVYKLTIAYDGTHYVGWQVQPRGLSIQELLQQKIEVLTRYKINLSGSGRTDAGVHALGQTAHFESLQLLDIFKFQHSLNSMLPDDIRVLDVELVDETFHARYKAKGKIYSYHLRIHPLQDPFRRLYSWHLPSHHFSKEKLILASKDLLGEHDFKGFASQGHQGVAAHDSIRTMHRVDFVEGDECQIVFEADGFLYKMVRNMVGTLVDIGRGAIPEDTVKKVLASHDRKLAGQAAPAHGLFLVKVIY